VTFKGTPLERKIVIGASLALALFGSASRSAALVELYAQEIGPRIARALGASSALLPFSLAELTVLSVAAALVALVGAGLWALARGRRPGGEAALRVAERALAAGLVTLTLFYALWGLNYARRSLPERQGWRLDALPSERAGPLLAALAAKQVTQVNALYLLLHRLSDATEPSRPRASVAEQDQELERALDAVATALADLSLSGPRSPAKTLRATGLVSKLKLGGFYFPFTGEANVNGALPVWQRPHVTAHEKAHQRGVASEDEASFLAVLACAEAQDPLLRYSGALFAQRRLLSELTRRDRPAAEALIARRLPGVQRDVDAARAFWAGQTGPLATLSAHVNDAYLTAHRVAGGLDSYNRVTRLLLLHAAQKSRVEAPAPR